MKSVDWEAVKCQWLKKPPLSLSPPISHAERTDQGSDANSSNWLILVEFHNTLQHILYLSLCTLTRTKLQLAESSSLSPNGGFPNPYCLSSRPLLSFPLKIEADTWSWWTVGRDSRGVHTWACILKLIDQTHFCACAVVRFGRMMMRLPLGQLTNHRWWNGVNRGFEKVLRTFRSNEEISVFPDILMSKKLHYSGPSFIGGDTFQKEPTIDEMRK